MSYLNLNEVEIKSVRSVYELTADDVKRDVSIIQNWIKQQKHLPQNITDDVTIEIFLVRNKFSVERVKTKLDAYYSLKNVYKKYFNNTEEIIPSEQPIVYIPTYLTPECERIIYIKMVSQDLSKFDFEKMVKLCILTHELEVRNDYCLATIVICDFKDMTFELLRKINPTMLHEYVKLFEGVYTGRVKSTHFINIPPFVNFFLTLLKRFLTPKMYSRIHLHDDLESLYKVVPQRYLAAEYNGEQESIKKYIGFMDKEYLGNRDMFKKLSSQVSNEAMRVGGSKYSNELSTLGTEGTFKKICID